MARSRIIAGLKDAVRYSRGDHSRGKKTIVPGPASARCSLNQE